MEHLRKISSIYLILFLITLIQIVSFTPVSALEMENLTYYDQVLQETIISGSEMMPVGVWMIQGFLLFVEPVTVKYIPKPV